MSKFLVASCFPYTNVIAEKAVSKKQTSSFTALLT